MILSIILPTYNSQDTIVRAIDSCLPCIDESEIVIVDDGSKDSTTDIIERKYSYLIKRKKIKLINTFHGGAGNARNIGIKNSIGQWVIFLDSDDEFLNFKSVIADLKTVKNKSVDIINYSANYKRRSKDQPFYIVKGKNLIEDNLGLKSSRHKLWSSRPAYKVIKLNFIKENKIQFPTDIKVGEDLVFNLQCLQVDPNILIKNSIIYKVIDNENSITHKIVTQNILDDGMKLVYIVNTFDILSNLKQEFIAKNFISILVRFLKSNNDPNNVIIAMKKYKNTFTLRKSLRSFFYARHSLNLKTILISWIIWERPSILKIIFPIMRKAKYSK